ncbi:hypothetical protein SDC9_160406 [bioreactor metagenome]|uniref:Uncharacterized protein n=1 Tax=bioreactor metagenome TaxID=1076179 RepID=A0A645FHH2_9ZZZZ
MGVFVSSACRYSHHFEDLAYLLPDCALAIFAMHLDGFSNLLSNRQHWIERGHWVLKDHGNLVATDFTNS